mmetsp:Transcript_11520/g.29034  ORF Transcript_11520/g.29034 Transcript_11520/m.29034 type:complete len:264 (+) Transcript_11520:3390-4181(+)
MASATCGACMRLTSSRRVCSGPSSAVLPFSTSSSRDVVSCTMLFWMSSSTTRGRSTRRPPGAATSSLVRDSTPCGLIMSRFCRRWFQSGWYPDFSQYCMIFSNSPSSARLVTTLCGASALKKICSAMLTSAWRTRSPSSSVHVSLSSANHFSSRFLRPCCSTGRASSTLSTPFSLPISSSTPKYCRRGDGMLAWVGSCWKRRMVSIVRSMPPGDSAATLAAALKSPRMKRFSNCCENRFSAPGRPLREARLMATSRFCSVLMM